jgi:putative salt-induced outer membrane protein YdiY
MKLKKTYALPLFMMFASAPVWADPVAIPSSAAVKTDGQWRGSFNAGLSAASGDTSSMAVNAAANATWANTTDKFVGNLTGLYGWTKDDNGNKSTANNLIKFDAEYDHDLTDKVYALGIFDAQRNELQDLNFQSSLGGGFGYHVVKTAPTVFDVYGGVSYNYEQYHTSSRNYPELLLGENWTQKIGPNTTFNERIAVYPNLGYIGNVRTQLDAGLTTQITDRLNWKITVSNSYQNHPVSNVKKTNTIVMTSIGYNFGPK